MISEFEARLAVVPRWCVVHTIQKQSVAEHSFYVALIAPRVAKEWYGCENESYHFFLDLNNYALKHDQYEAFSGDVAGMVKDCFDEQKLCDRYREFVDPPWMEQQHLEKVLHIVKCADLYERCFFMATELAMGNYSIGGVYTDNLKLLNDHMRDTGAIGYADEACRMLDKRCTFRTRTMDLRPK